jgi:hypothetical protein
MLAATASQQHTQEAELSEHRQGAAIQGTDKICIQAISMQNTK